MPTKKQERQADRPEKTGKESPAVEMPRSMMSKSSMSVHVSIPLRISVVDLK